MVFFESYFCQFDIVDSGREDKDVFIQECGSIVYQQVQSVNLFVQILPGFWKTRQQTRKLSYEIIKTMKLSVLAVYFKNKRESNIGIKLAQIGKWRKTVAQVHARRFPKQVRFIILQFAIYRLPSLSTYIGSILTGSQTNLSVDKSETRSTSGVRSPDN